MPSDPMIKIRQRLSGVLKQFKSELMPPGAIDQEILTSFEKLPGLFHGQQVKRVVLALSTRGCSLFRRPQGGCLHCGLVNDGIINQQDDHKDLVKNFTEKLNSLDFSQYPVLCIYTPGSFLDNDEIIADTQNEIISLVAQKKEIIKVVIESLPQFITKQKVRNLKTVLANKEIEIAVGLDSSTDQIRNVCINKGFSLKTFDKACNLLKQQGVKYSAFALLKPPFLNEQEAIADTVRTVHYAFKMGATAVSIEPNTVQQNTFTWKLFSKNLYRPPWLWSIIEVIKQLPPDLEIRIGGMVVYPRAVQSAHNCNQCTPRIWQRIQEYNLIQDKNIFADLDCTCKNQWYEELHIDSTPLLERIENDLHNLNR